MPSSSPARVPSSLQLGQGKKAADLFLGWIAVVPFVLLAALAWGPPLLPQVFLRTLGVIWAGSLLTFYAGVRRGLTFSEVSGGRWSELLTMLLLFFWGVASLVFLSPVLAAVGLALVGALDAWSGRRGEAPTYFTTLRPPQLGLAAICLILLALKG